jgi:hypothetical protein
MSLGGIDRGVDSTVNRRAGPLRNRGIGSSRSAGGISVSATIIDNEEIDRAILAASATKRAVADNAVESKAAELTKSVTRTQNALPDSVTAIREQKAAVSALQVTELAGYFAKARQAEVEGKPGVARVYYQMVVRGDQQPLKAQAQQRLAALSNGKAVAQR